MNIHPSLKHGSLAALVSLLAAIPSGPAWAGPDDVDVRTLASFTGGDDGSEPDGTLAAASNGNFYGSTTYGGRHGQGTVYQVDPQGVVQPIYAFGAGTHGVISLSSPILGSDGALYGVETRNVHAKAAVYRISLRGKLKYLHKFRSFDGEGRSPGPLMQASDGFLYGVVADGGDCHCGTVYRVSLKGDFTVLATLRSAVGTHPSGSLLEGDDGRLYGVAEAGGPNDVGSIFAVSKAGELSLVHGFDSCPCHPRSGLVYSPSHDRMYGTADLALFQWKDGVRTVIAQYQFEADAPVIGPDGASMYGFGDDGIYRILADSAIETVVNDLQATPGGRPTFSADGTILYGVMPFGGDSGVGSVFTVTGF